jgi:protein SCO1/2
MSWRLLVLAGIAAGSVTAFAQARPPHARHTMSAASHGAPAAAGATADAPSPHLMTPQPVIGDVPLVDLHGRATSLRAALETDEPLLVNFIFTSCTTICPVMSTGFSQLQRTVGVDRPVRLVSISIDPQTDTPDVLRAYARRYHAGASWAFLTGTRTSIQAAQHAFGAYRGEAVNHAPVTYVRRSRRAPWQALEGFASAAQLVSAFRDGAIAPGP